MSAAGGESGAFSRSASLVFVLSRDLSSARQAGVGLRSSCGRGQDCGCGEATLQTIACFLHRDREAVGPRAMQSALAPTEIIALMHGCMKECKSPATECCNHESLPSASAAPASVQKVQRS